MPSSMPTVLFLLASAMLGAMLGLLVRQLIHRLPQILLAASAAPQNACTTAQTGWPRRGRVELLCALWLTLCTAQWGPSAEAAAQGLAGLGLIALAFIDAEHLLLPDALTLPLLWAGLLAASLGWTAVAPAQALLGAALGYTLIAVPAMLYRWRTGTDGLGLGDAKLLAATGAWQGLMAVPAVLLIAGLSSLIWLAWRRRLRKAEVYAFGPWLATASLLSWLWPAH